MDLREKRGLDAVRKNASFKMSSEWNYWEEGVGKEELIWPSFPVTYHFSRSFPFPIIWKLERKDDRNKRSKDEKFRGKKDGGIKRVLTWSSLPTWVEEHPFPQVNGILSAQRPLCFTAGTSLTPTPPGVTPKLSFSSDPAKSRWWMVTMAYLPTFYLHVGCRGFWRFGKLW